MDNCRFSTVAEKTAYELGQTAKDRIGDKPMCYDLGMHRILVDATDERRLAYNRRIMEAWLIGRGWERLISHQEKLKAKSNE